MENIEDNYSIKSEFDFIKIEPNIEDFSDSIVIPKYENVTKTELSNCEESEHITVQNGLALTDPLQQEYSDSKSNSLDNVTKTELSNCEEPEHITVQNGLALTDPFQQEYSDSKSNSLDIVKISGTNLHESECLRLQKQSDKNINLEISQMKNMPQQLNQNARKVYECSICNETFTHKSRLRFHMRSHNDGNKPYECSDCGNLFVDTFHLCKPLQTNNADSCDNLIRVRTHKRHEMPYECSICFRRFMRLFALNIHMRTHTGFKPYECSICSQNFPYSSGYLKHVEVHLRENCVEVPSNSNPVECSICQKKFCKFSSLRKHAQMHSPYKKKSA